MLNRKNHSPMQIYFMINKYSHIESMENTYSGEILISYHNLTKYVLQHDDVVDASEKVVLEEVCCCPPISSYPFFAWTWTKHVSDQQSVVCKS